MDNPEIIGNNQQRSELTRIQQTAAMLGVMITNYTERYGELDIQIHEEPPVTYVRVK